jgi:hypothetical protein
MLEITVQVTADTLKYLLQKFVDGYCKYEGSMIEDFVDLDMHKCQAACRAIPECQVFVDYRSDTIICVVEIIK